MQGGPQISGTNQVLQGGNIVLTCTGGIREVYLGVPGSGKPPQAYPVPKDGKLTIPAPNVPAGTVVVISTGVGLDAKVHLVEVLGTE